MAGARADPDQHDVGAGRRQQSFGRGGPLQVYDAEVHAFLSHLPPDIDSGQVS